MITVAGNQIRELRGVLNTEPDAQLGGFISLQRPTKGMFQAAMDAERIELDGKKYDRVQIRTVEDLLAGRQFDTPTKVETLSWEKQAALPL